MTAYVGFCHVTLLYHFVELKSEIAKLRDAQQSESRNIKEYQRTMNEVASLKERLVIANRDKMEVDEMWRKQVMASENRKAQEIAELEVSFINQHHWL